jgi:zinc transport system substrate-binding protein
MARKILFSILLAFCLGLTACAPAGQTTGTDDGTTHLVATTYPVYLFTSEIVKGAENISVDLMINQPISCLHDYTLSVKDMKTLERADLIILNGAGLEETMEDALNTVSDTPQIDCSQGIDLLEGSHDHDHAGHDHDHGHEDEDADHAEASGHNHESDPHIWMDPNRVGQMLENLAAGLSDFDPSNAALYQTNCQLAQEQLQTAYPQMQAALQNLSCRELITFHDGFTYFAEAFDLEIVRSIEEEAGSEASAKDVTEIVAEIKVHGIPAIFTEVNGSDATAQMIHRECGVAVQPLTLMMGATDAAPGIACYLDLLWSDVNTLREAYA